MEGWPNNGAAFGHVSSMHGQYGAEYGEYTEQDAANWNAYQQQLANAQQNYLATQQQWNNQEQAAIQQYQYQQQQQLAAQQQLAMQQQQQIMAQWGQQVFAPDSLAAQYAGQTALQVPPPPPPPPPEQQPPASGPPPSQPPPSAPLPQLGSPAKPPTSGAGGAAQAQDGAAPSQPGPPPPSDRPPVQISAKEQEEIRQLQRADELFEKQFKSWEEQFSKWKEENRGTADTHQLRSYEDEMMQMKNKLLSRRDQLRHRLAQKLAKARGEEPPLDLPPPSDTPAGSGPSARQQRPGDTGEFQRGHSRGPSQGRENWDQRGPPAKYEGGGYGGGDYGPGQQQPDYSGGQERFEDQSGGFGRGRGGSFRGRGRGGPGRFDDHTGGFERDYGADGADYEGAGRGGRGRFDEPGRGGFGRGGRGRFDDVGGGWDDERSEFGPSIGRWDDPGGRGGPRGRFGEAGPHGRGRGGRWDERSSNDPYGEYADPGARPYDEQPNGMGPGWGERGRGGFRGRGFVDRGRGRGRGGYNGSDPYDPTAELDGDDWGGPGGPPRDKYEDYADRGGDEVYDPLRMSSERSIRGGPGGFRGGRGGRGASTQREDEHAVIDYGHQNAMDVVSKFDSRAGADPPPALKDAIESVFEAFKRPARDSSAPREPLQGALGALLSGQTQPRPLIPPQQRDGRRHFDRDPDGYGLGPSHPDDYADTRDLQRRRSRSRSRSPRRRSRSPRRRGSPPRRRRSRSPRGWDRSPPRGDRGWDRSPPRRGRYDSPSGPFRGESPPRRSRWSPPRDRGSRERIPPEMDREGRGRPPMHPLDERRRFGEGFPPERPRLGFEPSDRRGDRPGPSAAPGPPSLSSAALPPPPPTAPAFPTVNAMDLLQPPGRHTRPTNIVIVLRGPPGSGKTYTAKLIKDQEVANKGSAPRILSLDDYFCTEKEKKVTDSVTGKTVTKKVMEYEYDADLEEAYRASLQKVFRKTVDDGFFHFIILDCVNSSNKHYGGMCSYASSRGFKVYVAEMDMDESTCHRRNVHGRSLAEVRAVISGWQQTPDHLVRVDVRPLLQADSIQEVEMEDTPAESAEPEPQPPGEEQSAVSKWEKMDPSEERLAKLDGVMGARKRKDSAAPTMEDYLQLPDDYASRAQTSAGKKRVRWADVEEQNQQRKMRDLGFVVGQTDWGRMTDPTMGQSALTKTKYI